MPLFSLNREACRRRLTHYTFLWCRRLWRTGPALCQWSRETAALPPSTPLTTPSSPPPPPLKRWTNAGPASSRRDSTSGSSYLLHIDLLRVFISINWLFFFSYFFAAVTFCWNWWRRREIMSETSAWWWR